MIEILTHDQPETVLDQRLVQLAAAGQTDCFAVEYRFGQYYLPDEPVLTLLAIFELVSLDADFSVRLAVTDQCSEAKKAIAEMEADFNALVDGLQLAVFELSTPIWLQTVAIAKPWGQEIWYTGVEARGHSRFADERGRSVPMAWLLSTAPSRLAANKERSINLLKILDPLPEEVYGDLYFELHEEKREVYVVTNVDPSAWPDGCGAIRFGFNPKVRNEFDSDEQFRAAYLAAVENYELVRREIDALFDQQRQALGIGLNEPVPAEQLKQWHAELTESLQEKELQRRAEMNRFTAVKPLEVGDVVKVPCFTPHALQHGVRTVEFQTPVYERKILAFAQKVLTQDNWDTRDGVSLMNLDTPAEEPLEVVEKSDNHQLEKVVQFDDFEVFRLRLTAGSEWHYPDGSEYGLLMKISGSLTSAGIALSDEQAQFVPARRKSLALVNTGADDAVILLAQPRC